VIQIPVRCAARLTGSSFSDLHVTEKKQVADTVTGAAALGGCSYQLIYNREVAGKI